MANDADVVDAIQLQQLNPLRLAVSSKAAPAPAPTPAPTAGPSPKASSGRNRTLPNFMEGLNRFSATGGIEGMEKVVAALETASRRHPMVEIVRAFVDHSNSSAPTGTPASAKATQTASATTSAAAAQTSTAARATPQPAPAAPKAAAAATVAAATASAPGPSAPTATVAAEQPVVHFGVQCDGCNVLPIKGNRYKSASKHDYDLCSVCFEKATDKDDYNKIERSLYRPRHRAFQSCQMRHAERNARGRWGCGPPGMHGPCGPPAACVDKGKLDSRFVSDQTIYDGTEMAPGTQFTKIWRMRNSGQAAWPVGTRVVWVGGDRLGEVDGGALQLAPTGLAPEEEADVSVDLVAPPLPGRYVSHYRLQFDSAKFGHRVWVLIQVVGQNQDSPAISSSLAESPPPKAPAPSAPTAAPEPAAPAAPTPTLSAAPAADASASEKTPAPEKAPEPEAPAVQEAAVPSPPPAAESQPAEQQPEPEAVAAEEGPAETQRLNVAIHIEYEDEEPTDVPVTFVAAPEADSSAAPFPGQEPSSPRSSVSSLFSEDNRNDFVLVHKPEEPVSAQGSVELNSQEEQQEEAPVVAAEAAPEEVVAAAEEVVVVTAPEAPAPAEEDALLVVLLEQLQNMGFADRALNKEALLANAYDIQGATNDLIASNDWDQMLEDLEEMGFTDGTLNRRLLIKNKGNFRQTVKELVSLLTA